MRSKVREEKKKSRTIPFDKFLLKFNFLHRKTEKGSRKITMEKVVKKVPKTKGKKRTTSTNKKAYRRKNLINVLFNMAGLPLSREERF